MKTNKKRERNLVEIEDLFDEAVEESGEQTKEAMKEFEKNFCKSVDKFEKRHTQKIEYLKKKREINGEK